MWNSHETRYAPPEHTRRSIWDANLIGRPCNFVGEKKRSWFRLIKSQFSPKVSLVNAYIFWWIECWSISAQPKRSSPHPMNARHGHIFSPFTSSIGCCFSIKQPTSLTFPSDDVDNGQIGVAGGKKTHTREWSWVSNQRKNIDNIPNIVERTLIMNERRELLLQIESKLLCTPFFLPFASNAKNTTTSLNSTLSRPGDFSFLARALKEFFWLLCWICCTHPRNSTRRRWWWRFFFFGVSRAISHFQCPQFKIDRSWCSFCVVLGLRLSEFNSEVEDVSILAFLRSVLFIRASSLGVWCGIADSVYCGSTIINKTENICEEFPLTYSKNKHRLSQSRKSSQITEFSSSCDFSAAWSAGFCAFHIKHFASAWKEF